MNELEQARQIAARLATDQVDVNEVEKLLAYGRRVWDVGKIKKLIQRLARQEVMVYSKRTKPYMQAIERTLVPHLPADATAALELMGWTARLMRYYRFRRSEAQALLGIPKTTERHRPRGRKKR
jgi:hypothetical protein